MKIAPMLLLMGSLGVQAQQTPEMDQERAIAMTCINVAELTFYAGQEAVYKNGSLDKYVARTSDRLSIEQMQVLYGQYLNVKKWVSVNEFSTAKGYATAMFLECRDGLLAAAGLPMTEVGQAYTNGFFEFLGELKDDEYHDLEQTTEVRM